MEIRSVKPRPAREAVSVSPKQGNEFHQNGESDSDTLFFSVFSGIDGREWRGDFRPPDRSISLREADFRKTQPPSPAKMVHHEFPQIV